MQVGRCKENDLGEGTFVDQSHRAEEIRLPLHTRRLGTDAKEEGIADGRLESWMRAFHQGIWWRSSR